MKNGYKHTQRGVTLVELLIVMFMLGLFATAVNSLYRTHQNAAYTSDEVVEVQQNLRIAMDSITRDVRMAGFLIPGVSNCTPLPPFPSDAPIWLANDNTGLGGSDSIIMSTATSFETAATISSPRAGLGVFIVDDPTSVDQFSSGNVVTIVRPSQKTSTVVNDVLPGGSANTFRVTGTNRNANPPSITLAVNSGTDIVALYNAGDMIVRLNGDMVYPSVITYSLGSGGACPTGQFCLRRQVNAIAATLIAQNITGLQFRYLMDDNTEVDVPANYCQVRAVRVTLTGQTVATAALPGGGGAKTRQVESVIQIRNRNR